LGAILNSFYTFSGDELCNNRAFGSGGRLLFRSYTPASPLDRFIDNFWYYQGYSSPHVKERILQDGTFKTVFNLQHDEFRIYDPWQPIHCRRYSGAIVSRPSAVPFVTDSAEEACVLGVNFKIGGALPFLGYIASEPGASHVDLADIWGRPAIELQDRLFRPSGPQARFRLLESSLLRQLCRGNDTFRQCMSASTRSVRWGQRREPGRLRDWSA
jgi:Domain of unknown function (DUF6597)